MKSTQPNALPGYTRRHAGLRITTVACAICLAAQPAGAVIVGGLQGTGNNNNSQAGLDAYLATTSYAAFPYWNNLVRVADASGIYLGYNPATMRGWVLSAYHVTTPASITVAGNSYSILGGTTRIGSSDLKLYEIGGGPPMPSLPSVPLASVYATNGEFSLMFGRGYTNDTSGPFDWETPGTSDANGMRWGTNTIQGSYLLNLGTQQNPNVQPYLAVDFDDNNDPGFTAYDAQASLGDSGGGIFIIRNGVWELSGIAHLVDDGPDFFESSPTGDGAVNPSQYGDFSAYTDVRSYRTTITGVTGSLVPEPSSALLLAGGLALALRRRRD
jgi:hypothetical protein